MFLTYDDLAGIFPKSSGIRDYSLSFRTVSFLAETLQPKGLYIPMLDQVEDLQTAIANGAVAAIWLEGREIPTYTPNHFPIFYTDNLIEGIKKILYQYKTKIQNIELENGIITNFTFFENKVPEEYYQKTGIVEIEDQWKIILDTIIKKGGKENA